jgi:hypothetical protein
MDTKKVILTTIATTLATMFVVAVMMHLCRSHCGKSSSCSAVSTSCSSHSSCEKASSCASYSKCSNKKSCKGKSECSKGQSCEGKSKCSKGKSCAGDVDAKTFKFKTDDGKTIVKKVVEVEK